MALVPTGHALAGRRSVRFADTLDEPHIGLRVDGTVNRFMADKAQELGRTIRYRIHVESYDAMALMVEAGLGIGIVPKGIARPYSRAFGVRTVGLAEDWAARQLHIYFASYERLSAAARQLVDHLHGDGLADGKLLANTRIRLADKNL